MLSLLINKRREGRKKNTTDSFVDKGDTVGHLENSLRYIPSEHFLCRRLQVIQKYQRQSPVHVGGGASHDTTEQVNGRHKITSTVNSV